MAICLLSLCLFPLLLELSPVPERVPSEERSLVGDLPHLDQPVAVIVGHRPVALLQVGGPGEGTKQPGNHSMVLTLQV